MKIYIINSGLSNVSSVANMVKWVGFTPIVTQSIKEVNEEDKIIFPGIGNFSQAMTNLKDLDIIDDIKKSVLVRKNDFLGICLGMQLLMDSSEESPGVDGLGFIPGIVKKFDFTNNSEFSNLKVPHIGWNKISISRESKIFNNYKEDRTRYYFVHSYYVECKNSNDVLAKTSYGKSFDSIISKENIYGFQFHPEKSLKYGANLIKNFCELKK
tara:strand:+ start:400 stop:1035 length:636 start_codon:yes stop_codon:yes gene_type:complete